MATKKVHADTASSLRWQRFKKLPKNQGVDKLPPTSGAMQQHILRTHLQARIWCQDIAVHPVIPDPCQLGWFNEEGKLRPVLSHKQAAPEAVVELVKCSCVISACSSRNCTCRSHGLQCTELCSCDGEEGTCNNVVLNSDSSDDEGD